jgi:DNA-binding HxlR family transcriptional regulator
MLKREYEGQESCSVARALEVVGERWTWLIIRDAFLGLTRFGDFQKSLGIARNVLTDRLNRLVELGVIKTVPYQEPGHRARNEYRLTRKGVGLLPLMVALMQWGDEHVNADNPPVALHHRTTGERVKLELRTDSGPIEPNDIVPRQLP